MYIDNFCPCCYKISETYKNGNTDRVDRYCIQCQKDYTAKERKQIEFNNIFGIITPLIKE